MKMLPKSESVPMTSHNWSEISKVKNYLIVTARITVYHRCCSFSSEASKTILKSVLCNTLLSYLGYQ